MQSLFGKRIIILTSNVTRSVLSQIIKRYTYNLYNSIVWPSTASWRPSWWGKSVPGVLSLLTATIIVHYAITSVQIKYTPDQRHRIKDWEILRLHEVSVILDYRHYPFSTGKICILFRRINYLLNFFFLILFFHFF